MLMGSYVGIGTDSTSVDSQELVMTFLHWKHDGSTFWCLLSLSITPYINPKLW